MKKRTLSIIRRYLAGTAAAGVALTAAILTGCGDRETPAETSAGPPPPAAPAPEQASVPAITSQSPGDGPGDSRPAVSPADATTAAASPAPAPVAVTVPAEAVALKGPVFQLPTKNTALFDDNPGAFYMFVDRYGADGKVSQVWQGGGYGYVRNPRNTAGGEVFTKFHEGIDIAPVERSAAGEPQDIVHSIADGTVVFCSPNAASNYGNYVVIEHDCGEEAGRFYSLYAHLRRIDTTVGTAVKRGGSIALLGYTGAGIDRRRAHVHLEICLLLSDRFNDFWAKHYKLGNPNGNWHGHNLIGIDAAAFLKAARARPGLTPPEFLKSAEPYYKVRVPNKTHQELEIARRYPWLRQPGEPGASWQITYNTAGVPLAITPDLEPSAVPAVVWVKPFKGYHSWNTRNHLGGSGNTATLAAEGSRYQQLVSGDF